MSIARPKSAKWITAIALGLASLGLAAGFLSGGLLLAQVLAGDVPAGRDLAIYQARAAAWLGGSGFYLPHQLGGPYAITMGDATYPPPSLLLFVPFTVLPAFLWWAIPAAIAVAGLGRLRPGAWGWLALAIAVSQPRFWSLVLFGNPAIWSFALILAGAAWGWPAAAIALKLPLAPFAVVGIGDPRWRGGFAAALIAALAFAPMWPDYIAALLNARLDGGYGLGYALADWPLAALFAVGALRSDHVPGRLRDWANALVRRLGVCSPDPERAGSTGAVLRG